ncbi:hypothetical protein CDI07_05155 [Thermococcus sp. 5-4]|nr:hypothetical protein CDI07_05155 [Thermococcus sp. 5-4]
MRRLRITLLSLALLLLVLTVGLAVPSINVNVQELGAGSQRVVSPTGEGGFYVTTYLFGLVVYDVHVIFPIKLEAGTVVNVSLYSSNGRLLGSKGVRLTGDQPANTPLVFDFSSDLIWSSSVDLSKTTVNIVDGYYSEAGTGSIEVITQKIGVGKPEDYPEYVNPINITYSGSTTLTDWPVKVVLSGSDVVWSVLDSNPKSLYFMDPDGNLLNYWIEILDTTNDYAVVWVNIPRIPPGGTVVWMYYGNGDYSSYNDGGRVFPFFDDFEGYGSITDGGWEWYNPNNPGVRMGSDNFEYGGSQSAEKYQYFDRQDGVLKALGFTVDRASQSVVLEYWDKRVNVTRGSLDRVGLVDASGNGFGAVLDVPGDDIRIDTRTSYLGTTHARVNNVGLSTGTWYLVHLEILSNGTVRLLVYDESGYLTDSPLGSTEYDDDANFLFNRVYIKGGSTYRVDALRVRPYAPNEPQAQVDEWYYHLVFHPRP